VATDAMGKEYTNATFRDSDLTLDEEGFWLAEFTNENDCNDTLNPGFYPIDDFEYLDSAKTVKNPKFDWNVSGCRHNYSFAMKISAQFQYIPGQYFEFRGDDDVWVFIDNRLAVDIGGQHGQVAGAVDLDTIGQNTGDMLVPGKTYDFHIFYVERHTGSSNFRMRTSIDLQVEASLFLTSDRRGSGMSYEVWQINKKSKLSCNFDANSAERDTTGGASTFKLTGGNLAGPEILGVGTHYEGIKITSDSTFSIDSAAIVSNYALAPGHYFLEITLKADPSQVTKVEITVPPIPCRASRSRRKTGLSSVRRSLAIRRRLAPGRMRLTR
jgi:fibro-slime domain-containing protein